MYFLNKTVEELMMNPKIQRIDQLRNPRCKSCPVGPADAKPFAEGAESRLRSLSSGDRCQPKEAVGVVKKKPCKTAKKMTFEDLEDKLKPLLFIGKRAISNSYTSDEENSTEVIPANQTMDEEHKQFAAGF